MTDYNEIKKAMGDLHKSIMETAPEEYTPMSVMIDAVRLHDAEMSIFEDAIAILNSCVKEIGLLHEHIRALYEIIHDLEPEYDITETMAKIHADHEYTAGGNAAADTEHEKRDQHN